MTANELTEWLKSRPLISLRGLEKACNPPIPESTLRKVVKGTQLLPEKHVEPLIIALKNYGLK